jgi:hypothetical protein
MIRLFVIALTGCLLHASVAAAQASDALPSLSGTVVSSTRSTLVVRAPDDSYRLFMLDRDTTRPPVIQAGSEVTVISRPSGDANAPLATVVRVTAPPAVATTGTQETDNVPASVRNLEQDIQRQASRYRLGIRTGATLDQELFEIGAHGQIGPFFRDAVWARPNIEFGFGEVTTLIALNLEGIYRVPITDRASRWAVFFGGGPGFNFYDRGFEDEDVGIGEEPTRFDDFDFDVGLNLLMGVQTRGGTFFELKTGIYAKPTLRFIIGYNF